MAKVRFEDTSSGLDRAVSAIFDSFGGPNLLKPSRNVFLKTNGIDFKPHVYTSPEVIAAIVRYFYSNGALKVFVMENCTQANFTRLVFDLNGTATVCKTTGAIPIYLDETEEIPMYLPNLKSFVNIPDFVHEHLIQNRKDNLYISVPKLKTHSMTTVTLGIKNQFGLIHQKSRISDHNFKLHQKLADIYTNIQPDFTIIDGIEATNYGHYPVSKFASKCVVKTNILLGGNDALAVDVVGAKFLGFSIDEVQHLKLSAVTGYGESDFEKIEIENQDIFEQRKQKFSCDLLGIYPEDVKIIRGNIMCCKEGCMRNTEAVIEALYSDYDGKGGFCVLMGKGINPEEIAGINTPVHIAGDCAIMEWYPQLIKKIGKRNITISRGCNNLAETINGLTKWMGVSSVKMVPASLIQSISNLALAMLNGSKANIANIRF